MTRYPGGGLDISHPTGPGLARVHDEGHVGQAVAVVGVSASLQNLQDEVVDIVLGLRDPLSHDSQDLGDTAIKKWLDCWTLSLVR